ncbi:hypothetical protein FD876_19025 [Acinetobacter baumannii]|uniref:hypothetical protein n=1 Tax=Acinetobacter baumannii TaxID=470 RepID=UPI0010FD6438|nr:hypothetical protein [Acinetobacter baumannii]MCA4238408.1 hypothetical protein [Acinetobacter baumannii]MDN8276798.1 hypothetical protein [Acinetobacter baumannii]TLT02411.1 hypothetical protein FD876_19025 [Acinetobacter baumannii]TLT70754.1 hypothetical protein FD885_18840 [Acinetobacter baumannii]
MANANTTVLELLGKQVSFVYVLKSDSDEYSLTCSGVVTDVIISLNSELQLSVDNGDFYIYSDLKDFSIKSE